MALAETFRGSLLTRHFVAHVLPNEFAQRLGEASAAGVRRRCLRWLREAQGRLGPASGVRAICEAGAVPLVGRLGYGLRVAVVDPNAHVIVATLEGARGIALTLVITRWQDRLDQVWRVATRAGLRARHRWCLCFNGHQLRIVDVDRPYARRYLEFDLARTLEDERGFQLLWALLRPAAFAAPAGGDVETKLLDQIVAACDAHGGSVRESLQLGVRHALESLALALAGAARRTSHRNRRMVATRSQTHDLAAGGAPPLSGPDIVAQALTVIYRLLFLLFAEARMLVPVWHPIYRDSYSIGGLHALAERRLHRGLWHALQAISRLAHDGCAADDLSVTAFNGQLFSPEHTPLGEHAQVDGAIIAQVLDALMTTPARGRRGRDRITYADLGVEQLGTVYERVLDYAPQLERQIATDIASGQIARIAQRIGGTPQPTGQTAQPTGHTAQRIGHTPQTVGRTARSAGRTARDNADAPAATRALRITRRSSVRRKESGSFYTPRSMADYLVRVTLGPLVSHAAPDEILALRVLDPAMGSGAFLVSACRFLAHAYEQACERDGRSLALDGSDVASAARTAGMAGTPGTAGVVSAAGQADVRRHIARHCLFGVDFNPMAVQLARLSLWLTTMMKDAPLTFLDHHLRVGDSLVGASLDDLVRRPPAPARVGVRAGRRQSRAADLPLFSGEEQAHVMRAILPARARLTAADDCPETVREKERLLRTLARDSALARWLRLADVWCSSWFARSRGDSGDAVATDITDATGTTDAPPPAAWPAIADYLLHEQAVLPARTLDAWLMSTGRTASRRRFFHWTLEFPEVFFDEQGQPLATGGFDAIIGNPPWDMVRNDAQEETDAADRETAALGRFVRESGLYGATGDAHLNCYQLFVERSLTLLKRGGRFGLVLPWGLAADHGSALLRRRLLESCDLDTLVSFENRHAIFPIHRSTRFLLMTGTTARATRAVRCRFGERDPTILDTLGDEHGEHGERGELTAPHPNPLPTAGGEREASPRRRRGNREASPRRYNAALTNSRQAITLTMDLLRRVSGEALAFPDVRTPRDLAILERLHTAWPALASPDGWSAKFGRELNASDDRGLFTAASATATATAPPTPPTSTMPVIDGKHLQPFIVTLTHVTQVVRPDRLPQVLARLPDIARPRLAYREIASPTNRLTLIAAMLPARVVSTHTVVCLKSALPLDAQWCLCALLNSLVANYLVRMRVGTHVSVALLEQLPVPKPLRESTLFRDLASLAEQLSRTAENTAAKPYAHLQALAARAYALNEGELRYVLNTFPLIDEDTKRATLEAFRA